MSRSSLIGRLFAFMLLAAFASRPAMARNPHLDLSTVSGGCAACHQGHGMAQSPMLPAAQKQLCLSCHGSLSDVARNSAAGLMSPAARPPLVGDALGKLFSHALTADALAAGPNVVTCTSCHSPHRGRTEERAGIEVKRSTRDPSQAEFELCTPCHGRSSVGRRSGISQKFDPNNRSYHPVEAPANERSSSVQASAAGHRIACTDCHGNDDRNGSRGPHGSNEPFLLRAKYRDSDGTESPQAFELCYGCHDRKKILQTPLHARHVARQAACRTCHDSHGSVSNRALVHIGENNSLQQVLPSPSTGKLAFLSDAPGSGQCYLTCHGVDHGPKSYGSIAAAAGSPLTPFPLLGQPPVSMPQLGGERERPRHEVERPRP